LTWEGIRMSEKIASVMGYPADLPHRRAVESVQVSIDPGGNYA
jgi:hypothetical protein